MNIGQRVKHKVQGEGVVLEIFTATASQKVFAQILFDNGALVTYAATELEVVHG